MLIHLEGSQSSLPKLASTPTTPPLYTIEPAVDKVSAITTAGPNDCPQQSNNCEGGNCFAGVVPLSLREQSVKTRVNMDTYHPTTTHRREELTMILRTHKAARTCVSRCDNSAKQCLSCDGNRRRHGRHAHRQTDASASRRIAWQPSNTRAPGHQNTKIPEHPSARAQEYLERSARSTLCPQLFSALFTAPWSDLSGLGAALRRAPPTPEPITNQ